MTSPFGRRKDRSRFRGMESISDFGGDIAYSGLQRSRQRGGYCCEHGGEDGEVHGFEWRGLA
jgi:hypothetical protein